MKVKYADCELITRSRTFDQPFSALTDLTPQLGVLLDRTEAGDRKVRLLGVSFFALSGTRRSEGTPLDLFTSDVSATEMG